MRPGDIIYQILYVVDTMNAAVTGKVTGDFTVTAYINDDAGVTPTFAVTEIGSGYYRIAITTSGDSGWHNYAISEGSDSVTPFIISGDVTDQDEDSLAALVTRPVVSLQDNNQLGSTLNLEIVAFRYTPFSIAVTDQAGEAIDFSVTGQDWDNIRFSVWDKTHSGTLLYELDTISPPADGVFSLPIPEDAEFFDGIDAQITAGNDSMTLYYDLIGDYGGDATKTQVILRGQLTVYRYEGDA